MHTSISLPDPSPALTQLLQQKNQTQLQQDLQRGELWLLLAASAAFLASSFFVVKYFVGGDLDPSTWSLEQWLNALLGLAITAVITAAQAFLYASGSRSQSTVVATVIVVFFGLFAEISQSMEREDATVRQRSLDSPVFQAALASINTLAQQAGQLSPEQHALAEAQANLQYWQAQSSQKSADSKQISRYIAQYQQQVSALQHQVQLQSQQRSHALGGTIQQAKALEYDEDQHYMMIRLIKNLFGTSGILASFLFSVIIIGTFEYAFYFVGRYVTEHRQALRYLEHPTPDSQTIAVETAFPTTTMQPMQPSQQLHLSLAKMAAEPLLAPTLATQQAAFSYALDHQHPCYAALYPALRHQIQQGTLSPTTRPVTQAISNWLKQHAAEFDLILTQISKPSCQELAHSVLAQLALEQVIQPNQRHGAGHAKYVLPS